MKFTKVFVSIALLLTFLEILGLTPLFRLELIEVGTPNLIIIITLQGISYYVWLTVLQLYSVLDETELFGASDLIQNTSTSFLVSTLTKGLYISILFHFFNNFLNSIIWGAKISNEKLHVIKLLAESDRADAKKNHTVCAVIKFAGILNTQTSNTIFNTALTSSKSKILFLLLHSINDNYLKYSQGSHVAISNTGKTIWSFTFTPVIINSISVNNTWSRNLGTMKQLLRLTQLGDITISNTAAFTTTLLFNIGKIDSNDSVHSTAENNIF